MAVNLAVLTAIHRAKERSIEVDANKLQAYLQFTAKVNLPEVINDVDYCDKQIDKINSKGQLFSSPQPRSPSKTSPTYVDPHPSRKPSQTHPKRT